jgi:hypothetical protein
MKKNSLFLHIKNEKDSISDSFCSPNKKMESICKVNYLKMINRKPLLSMYNPHEKRFEYLDF